ncbi:hypothetical protein CC78DRAFT_526317 [Lojkania enalia]|uniref:HPP transmembrane region domain-containing protein n=1 Tax=Lojkania enalia TaxID=147567 RepID=A0A9P4JXN4_9PLEO|nr:hypothetical protein CC78DRAFT_526317 [Didymosphaeria enalia]
MEGKIFKLDPFVEAERRVQSGLSRLPPIVSHFLGYRSLEPLPSPTWMVCLWSFIGAFGGIGILFAVFDYHGFLLDEHSTPGIVASYGASAILCYGAIDVPLAQPRALIFGHFLSALIGVIIQSIFKFSYYSLDSLNGGRKYDLQWLAGSLAVSIALVVMHLTKTTHPPAGATALLPVLDPHMISRKWMFLPLVLVSSLLVLASALLVNNIQRRYPVFWIVPIPKSAQASRTHDRDSTPSPDAAEVVHPPQKEVGNGLGDLEAART